ncbi:MAG: DnaJ domain-containing protein, partial [Deltaproteobacteria bacterium]|nr:DnaJ domain-containing protein [Deltaproteobacteria bacterium]
KKAYRRLAGKYHPDRVNHLGEEFKELAERRFKEIQDAYQDLMA